MNNRDYLSPLSARLTKRWFVLRHGQSEANVAGIVASQLANAETAFGLTGHGREEVENSVRPAREDLLATPPLRIVTSPFLRTRETAEIAGVILGVQPITDHRLIERDFGDYELLPDAHYHDVWKVDPTDPENVPGHAESVYEVTGRVCDLILEVEKNPDIETCLLVTHCDVAMILSCAFQNLDPRHHRSLDPIKTGEVRHLIQAPVQ
ncbi:MAG: histidine phosphatase family protein [Verrucomicrobiales bacterium]|nr:histidine phosphatase family protein [Verrucomicrobiales bacterium]